MHRLQEIVRLHRLETSARTIARQLTMGRNTIKAYLDALATAGVLEGDPTDLPGFDVLRAIVEEHVPAMKAPQQSSTVKRWRSRISALRNKGAKPTAIHDWLRLHEPDYEAGAAAGPVTRAERVMTRRPPPPAGTDRGRSRTP